MDGSRGHLIRFDGFEFSVFNTATTPVIRDRVNRVSAGLSDTLWIGLEDGTIVSLSKGQFAELGKAPRQPTAMVQDRSGALIVAGNNYQLRWTGTRSDPLQVPGGWRLAQAQPSARRDAAGDAWLIGRDGSLLRVRDGVGEPSGTTESRQLVMQPSRGALLRVRRSGSIGEVVDAEGSVLVRFRWAPMIRPILVDRQGRLWAGQRRGVNVYEPGRVEPAARIDLEDRAAPGSMLEDRAGNIWLSGLGLTRIQEIPFRTITRKPGLEGLARQVRRLAPGPHGSLLAEVVLGEPGVYQFGRETVTRVVAGPSTAWADSSGTVWIAGRGDRVALVGRRDGKPDIVIPRSVAPPLLIAANPSRAGSFWFVGHGALYHADPYADAAPRIVDSITVGDHARQLAVDHRGIVWAVLVDGAGDQTLVRWAGGEMRRWSRRDGLTAANIRAIMPDRDGSLWLGTYGGGLIRLASDRFQTLAHENGLAEDVVSCILDDRAGNLWMAGNRGVHRVRRDDAIAFLEARAPRVLGVAYGRREGLSDPETTGDACARSDDGRLWFPFGGAAVVARGTCADSVRAARAEIGLHNAVAGIMSSRPVLAGVHTLACRQTCWHVFEPLDA
jgi:ligand-binding sensor domain-containing protein